MSDGFITGPLFKAMQLRAFAESLAAQKEEREQRRQLFQSELEQRTRQNQLQDLQTTHALQSMGALPVEAGIPGNFRAALGGRAKPVDTPVGRYSLPTTAQSQGYAASEARRAGTLEGIKKKASEDITDPDVTVDLPGPAPGFGNTVTVKESKRLEAMTKAADLYAKRNPHLVMKDTPPNDQGDIIRTWNDPVTGEEKKRLLLPGAGKSARPIAGAQKNYEAEVDANFEPQRERRIGEMMPWAYAQLGINPTAALPEDAEKARKLAEQNVDNAIKLEYKKQVAQKRLAGQRDIAPIPNYSGRPGSPERIQNHDPTKPSQRQQLAAPPSSVKATELNDLLKRTNTKRTANGLPPFDINGLRKELAGRGVTIQE